MKITSLLLATCWPDFTVFGLNGFPTSSTSHPGESTGNPVPCCRQRIALCRLLFRCAGSWRLLLLSGYFVPLALTVLAAELYNILAFH